MKAYYLMRPLYMGAIVALWGASATAVFAQSDNSGSSPFAPFEEPNRGTALEPDFSNQGTPPNQERPSAFGPNNSQRERDAIDAFQVRMTETDYLAGRLRVLDPYSGKLRGVRRTDLLIIQDGDVVSRSQTGVDGVAQIKNLPAGEYSVVAIGPDGMAAFGFEVLPAAGGVTASTYRFDTLLVPGQDIRIAQQSICQGDDPTLVPVPSRPAGALDMLLSPIPASASRGAGQVGTAVQSTALNQGDNLAVRHVSAPLKGQPILIRDGETGRGQLVILDAASGEPIGLANARVSFLRSGQILESVQTDNQGYCGVIGLQDGVYSMVGVGTNGFIALGIQVQTSSAKAAPGTTISSKAIPGDQYVSTTQYGPPPVGWRVAGAPLSAMGYAPGFACGGCGQVGCCGGCGLGPAGGACGPMAGGYGFAGCGGFGGGGFGGGGLGGGGLLGALVGAGLGAAIGAAVASDDEGDDKRFVPVDPNDPRDPDDPSDPDDSDDDSDDDDDDDPRPPVSPYLPPR